MAKLKLGSYWASACGGCDVAILDVHEKILDIDAAVDILFWPIALDFKVADVEGMPDGHMDVTLFHGAVRNSENEHMARLLRRKSKVLVAFGSCAHLGGIPSLANLYDKQEIFQYVYHDSPSTVNAEGVEPQPTTRVPEGEITIPRFYDTVMPLDFVVDVDYYVPGCPPTPKQIWNVVTAILAGNLPAKGSVVGASLKTQCDECHLKKNEKKITRIKRIATEQPEHETCYLEQGFLCMGPVTRGGCETRCQLSGVPCRGCYGPVDGVLDMGAKAISAIASVIEAKQESEIEQIVAQIPDSLRTFNRFAIGASLLRRKTL
jgi:F420-non-reducing hydrogenase small subunit